MKREIIITLITILIIIIADVVTQNYTKECVSETNNRLNDLKEKILSRQDKDENLKLYSEEIYNDWKNSTNVLAYYIEHDELEKVDVQMQIITADLEAEVDDDTISEIEQAIYLLHHIEEKRALNLKNVF